MPTARETFTDPLLSWYAANGRHHLPWRHPDRSPFHLLVAEILLQRTTATAVAGVYRPFIARYPTPAAVASAPSGDLEAMVAPLGLETRAEYLERAAGQLLARHDGEVPSDRDDLLALHGVGEYTAGSVLAHAHGDDAPAVDTNVDRVLSRFFDLDSDEADVGELADDLVVPGRASDLLHALIDFGAAVCTARSPDCGACPLASECATAAVAGEA